MVHVFRASDLWTVPGCLSLSRVAFAIVFPFAVNSPLAALLLVALAALSDFFDGWYARRFGLNSPTGAILDPITDKVFATSVVISLIATSQLSFTQAVLLHLRELGELPLVIWLWCTPRARALRARELGSNLLGKVTTALQFCALISVLLDHRADRLWIAATAGVGAVAAFSYFLKFRGALHAEANANGASAVSGS